jgi:hypothetical protein
MVQIYETGMGLVKCFVKKITEGERNLKLEIGKWKLEIGGKVTYGGMVSKGLRAIYYQVT